MVITVLALGGLSILSIFVGTYGMLHAAAEKSRCTKRIHKAYELERMAAADLQKVASFDAMRRRFGRRG